MDPTPEASRPHAGTPRPAPLFPAFAAFLALRFLFARRINLIGVVGIAVGVWALIVVVAVFSGFISDIRGGIRQVSPDLLLTEIPSDASFEQVDAVLRADPDVVATAPRLRYHALYFRHGWGSSTTRSGSGELNKQASDYDFVELIGIDPLREVEVTELLQQVLLPQSWETRSPQELFEIPGEMVQRWRSLLPSRGGLLVETFPWTLQNLRNSRDFFLVSRIDGDFMNGAGTTSELLAHGFRATHVQEQGWSSRTGTLGFTVEGFGADPAAVVLVSLTAPNSGPLFNDPLNRSTEFVFDNATTSLIFIAAPLTNGAGATNTLPNFLGLIPVIGIDLHYAGFGITAGNQWGRVSDVRSVGI